MADKDLFKWLCGSGANQKFEKSKEVILKMEPPVSVPVGSVEYFYKICVNILRYEQVRTSDGVLSGKLGDLIALLESDERPKFKNNAGRILEMISRGAGGVAKVEKIISEAKFLSHKERRIPAVDIEKVSKIVSV